VCVCVCVCVHLLVCYSNKLLFGILFHMPLLYVEGLVLLGLQCGTLPSESLVHWAELDVVLLQAQSVESS